MPPGAHDTIVAVSSPPGRAPRGIVRLAGLDAHAVLAALITQPAVDDLPPRQLKPARLADPPIPALVHRHVAPASYTGEPAAELQLPGHPALLERLIQQAIDAGARLAEPGEFTFRAYTAGKLDLTQAEGVAATIAAVSDSQLRAATLLRQGRLGSLAETLVDRLSDTLALVEAGIDFSDEEDVAPIAPADLADRLRDMQAELDALLTKSRSWGAVEALPRVVLVGPPSTGKTALFNALLGRTRAVVDPMPGTTRDVLSEPLTLTNAQGQTVECMLVDLAGLDEPAEALDAQMQRAARDAIDRADLLLLLRATDQPADWQPPAPLPDACPRLRLQTKSDLSPDESASPRPDDHLPISVTTGHNLDTLKTRLADTLGDRAVSLAGDMLALQPRHEQAISTAVHHLTSAARHVEPQRGHRHIAEVEVLADEMRAALDALAALGGRMTPDDVLGKVFATFCIGK